jgi:guanylate kinase
VIAIIGASATGKTTIERILEKQGLERIISYTSRPMRKNEINDVDYHFISDAEFLEKLEDNFFAEHTSYRGWHYGISKNDCANNTVAVVEPVGFRRLKKIDGLNIRSFYIKTDDRTRMIRMLKRGDDIAEAIRRMYSDQGSFNGIEDEVDYIIENPDGKLDEAVKNIFDILEKIE